MMLIVMLLSGTATSQLPEFTQQYRQRLGGAIDALEEILADFNRDAARYGLTSAEAIARQKSSEDPFIRARGDSMLNAEIRLSRLKLQREELETAGPLDRMIIFARGFDPTLGAGNGRRLRASRSGNAGRFASAGVGALGGLLSCAC